MVAIDYSHIVLKTEEAFVTFSLHKTRWSVTFIPSGELDCEFYRLRVVKNLSYPQVNSPALKIRSLSAVRTCLAWATSLWSVMHLYFKLKSPLPYIHCCTEFLFGAFFTHCFYISLLFCCKSSKFSNESPMQFQGTMLFSYASLFSVRYGVKGNACTTPISAERQL